MKLNHLSALFFISSILSGCYGTKVGPPAHSSTPPPGISSAPTGPGNIAIPPSLQGAMMVYRQQLLEQAHHLSPDVAEKYADAEILSLKNQYRGRDADLRSEIVQRLQRVPVEPAPRTEQNGNTGYPSDTTAK